MNKIKYWIYYIKDKDVPYAYTDNKDYAKAFEQNRDMDMFKRIKKDISKQEINRLAREYQNGLLTKVDLDVYDKANESWFTWTFIMTADEYFSLTLAEVQLMESFLYKHCWEHPGKFKNKIIKALEVLEYNNVNRYLSLKSDTNVEIRVKPDLLGIFLHYYGKTMKGIKR